MGERVFQEGVVVGGGRRVAWTQPVAGYHLIADTYASMGWWGFLPGRLGL